MPVVIEQFEIEEPIVVERLPFLVSHGAPGDGFGEAGRDAGGRGAEVFPGGLHGGAPEGGRIIGFLSGEGKDILPWDGFWGGRYSFALHYF